MSNKLDFGFADKRTVQNVRRYCLVCGSLSLILLFAFHISDFLILYPIWTLQSLSLVYALVYFVVFHIGLFRDSQHSQWEWDRFTKFRRKAVLITKVIILVIISLVIFHTAFVMFGAPFFHDVFETFHFSLFVTSLVILPGCLQFGCESHRWLRIILGIGFNIVAKIWMWTIFNLLYRLEIIFLRVAFTFERPKTLWEITLYRSGAGLILGAWVGAFAIPLDWDEPWQAWPISSTYGALFCYSLMHFYNYLIMARKRQDRRL